MSPRGLAREMPALALPGTRPCPMALLLKDLHLHFHPCPTSLLPLRRLLLAQCAPSHKHHRKAVLENPLPRAHLRDPPSPLLALLGPSARLLHPRLHQDIARPLASPPPAGTGLLSTKEGRECSFSAPCALPGAWERCLPARSSFRLGVLLPPALEAAGAQRPGTAVPATRRPPVAPRHKGWPG